MAHPPSSRNDLNRTVGITLIRLLAGLVFFLQGYAKVFTWGLDNVYAMAFGKMEAIFPQWLLGATNYFTASMELLCGLLLIVGLFRDYAIYVLGLVLLVVSFGHGAAEGIWKMDDVIFRAILLAALLFLPREWDRFSLDAKLGWRW